MCTPLAGEFDCKLQEEPTKCYHELQLELQSMCRIPRNCTNLQRCVFRSSTGIWLISTCYSSPERENEQGAAYLLDLRQFFIRHCTLCFSCITCPLSRRCPHRNLHVFVVHNACSLSVHDARKCFAGVPAIVRCMQGQNSMRHC